MSTLRQHLEALLPKGQRGSQIRDIERHTRLIESVLQNEGNSLTIPEFQAVQNGVDEVAYKRPVLTEPLAW